MPRARPGGAGRGPGSTRRRRPWQQPACSLRRECGYHRQRMNPEPMRSDAPEPHAPPATTLEHLRRIAGAAAGTKSADGGLIVRGIATIADAGPEHVTWIV